ncbi:uncharacterized protein DUF2846 [Halospina denitrificans]|uniref:Uncharacterized protein DUF2846 n=1 Tax=Halospina denitrificans TaxID=332522 RepID=A0A4R7K2H4_9GAMM|nr:DUF2846 domain-containing protein [Halospina denitrificans]TDT44247.1 uncharacterized protein DUF2846 [Halospina denitrificans]
MRTKAPALTLILLSMLLLNGCGMKIYQSLGKDMGAYVRPVTGPEFSPVPSYKWNGKKQALVYFYRPESQWGNDEIMAPSFYVDDNHYFNLRANGYTWLVILAGQREFDIRRPFNGIEGVEHMGPITLIFDHILDTEFKVEAGETYYLRYSEVDDPESTYKGLPEGHPLSKGPARLVPEETALPEIRETRLLLDKVAVHNSAAQSIVEDNLETDYQRRRAELLEQRKEEIQALKESGDYESASWYWPWGGGPTKRLETDRKLRQLEREREERLAQESDGHWWWPFG